MVLIRSGGLPLSAWEPMRTGLPDWGALQEKTEKAALQVLESFDSALAELPENELRTAVYNARKDFFQRRKCPQGKTAERLSGLPGLAAALLFFQQNQQEALAAEALFEENLRLNLRHLRSLAADQESDLCRALLFASHDLLSALQDFGQKEPESFGRKDRRRALSLLQYTARAVFKTSPLSRFTTVQALRLGDVEPDPDVFALGNKHLISPHAALLPALYEVLLKEPAFYRSLQLRLNPSAQQAPDGSLTWLYFDGEREAFQTAPPDPLLDWLFDALGKGKTKTFSTVLTDLEEVVDAPLAELEQWAFSWADRGLLEWLWPEKGLSAGWAGALYQYLGHLPSAPLLTDAAFLLQWLRTAGRSLAFLPSGEAMSLQREAVAQIALFFQKNSAEDPGIPPEQVFWEDVAAQRPFARTAEEVGKLVGQLSDCWRERSGTRSSAFKRRLLGFAARYLLPGETADFMAFCRSFLENGHDESSERLYFSQQAHQMGALLQLFREKDETKAVVNALYAGGGKMWARWLPLFPSSAAETLRDWAQASGEAWGLQFPWQSWTNANFQPFEPKNALSLPGDRGGCGLQLSELGVHRDHAGGLRLVEKKTGRAVALNDLGLEAPESRPPAMQVLWHLGVPFVSADALLPEQAWETADGYRHHRRVTYGSLVLARERWDLPPDLCGQLFPEGRPLAERVGKAVGQLKKMGIPPRFFAQNKEFRAKPQYFDMECPLSMLLFEKLQRESGLLVTEMLPMPEQCLHGHAEEIVVEWRQ